MSDGETKGGKGGGGEGYSNGMRLGDHDFGSGNGDEGEGHEGDKGGWRGVSGASSFCWR